MATLAEALEQARRLLSAGQLAQAEPIYRQIVAAVPQAADAWHELGIIYLHSGRPDRAVEFLEKAAALEPGCAAYHSNLGVAYRTLKRPGEAVASFERAISAGPATPELNNNLALAYKDARRFEDAERAFDAALAQKPDYANGHFNRGNLLADVGRLDEAIASYDRAIELNPVDAGAFCKRGIAHYDLGELDVALADFDRALELQPDYPEVRRNRALIYLARGDYARGWPEYAWRLACEEFAGRPARRPRWDGSPLGGRRLLVYAEQGLGDTLQFIRYVPLVAESAGEVRIEVQAPLVPLLRQSGFGKWLAAGPEPGEYDVECPLLNLPGLLLARQPLPYWPGEYLAADDELTVRWRARLQAMEGFRVGILWAGNPDHPHDRFRSVALEQFAPLAAVGGVRLISLQKGAGHEQLAKVGAALNVVDFGDELDATAGAFMDTAAIMRSLDLVIAIDSSAAHLAGALGVPVWVPLQISPDWRWQILGERTAWYPSMRLFRQRQFDRWQPVFAAMAAELARTAGGEARPGVR